MASPVLDNVSERPYSLQRMFTGLGRFVGLLPAAESRWQTVNVKRRLRNATPGQKVCLEVAVVLSGCAGDEPFHPGIGYLGLFVAVRR